jgi:hypothetical protein
MQWPVMNMEFLAIKAHNLFLRIRNINRNKVISRSSVLLYEYGILRIR